MGISDWVAIAESPPPYWKPWMPRVLEYLGDPADPAQRAEISRRSPLHFADRVRRPLLVIQGANDVRVQRSQSDRMVEAVRAAGGPVEYMLIENEGHAIRRWQNQVRMYRRVEDFLAEHLGGRASDFDRVEAFARIF